MKATDRRRHKVSLAIAAVLMLSTGLAGMPQAIAASTYYVDILDPAADNNNPGTDPLAPWETLGASLNKLKAGDTLMVGGGQYTERIGCYIDTGARKCTRLLDRTANGLQGGQPLSSRVLVKAVAGQRPVIYGLLWLRNFNYYTFDGINVAWNSTLNASDEPTIKILGGTGWSYRNAEIWNAKSYGNVFIGTSNLSGQPASWSLTGNCIYNTRAAHSGAFMDHNVYIGGSEGTGTVARNIMYSAPSGKNIKVGSSTPSGLQPKYVTIKYNTLYNATENILVAYGARNITIDRNIVHRATGKDWYPNIRGYTSTGGSVVAKDNLGYDAAALIRNTDSTTGVRNGGGNVFPRNPNYDGTSCSTFHPRSQSSQLFGRFAGIPVTGHWTGAGTEDFPGWFIFGSWRLRNSNTTGPAHTSFSYGASSDKPVVGDWDGDGIETAGVFRSGKWILTDNNSTTSKTFTYGKSGDRPVVGDWDGNGTDTIGVVRGRTWLLRNANNGGSTHHTFTFARSTDIPVVGNWDGVGGDTPGVFRSGTWYLRETLLANSASTSLTFGNSVHRPVAGDWNGDGVDTIGAVKGATWALRNTNTTGSTDVSYVYDLM